MDPIEAAIDAIESREPGAPFSYRAVAKRFGVDRTTLSRRHKGLRQSNATAHQHQQLLNPQQEHELVLYIERCTRRGLPPTREMVQNFAETIAKCSVSERWVSRFLNRHADELTIKWSASIDRNRHNADSEERYKLWFDMLHSKIDWMTLIACVCASGEALPPALIYEGKTGIQSSWVDGVEPHKHEVLVANSPSGWKNNELGVAWLEQVFERFTKTKARRRWRLLILDGHGSHVSSDFIDSCDGNKILLAIFPPHATHSLQPLDVVLFAPLSSNYSRELDRYLQRSQGLVAVKKRDFFSVFWPAWSSTMSPGSIRKSFQATGVWPMDAQVILQRLNNSTIRQDGNSEIG
ncbi:hypothetical protein P3342_001681 [Pyrenophora teres f. teres]|uniref:Pogo transposable element n=1 Tax=Pyrenophora teres f. teres TaxID=97479 RepID=A0A6S6VVB3_9PLEO|nr:hypothetical protein P3342_001681 [Pyrenophora teres f. teres]CAE7002810.1 Pogo transposable element [Pyrenophora teres f. teres]